LAKIAENCDHNIGPWSPCKRHEGGKQNRFSENVLLGTRQLVSKALKNSLTQNRHASSSY
jgi:hypothetical protein